MKKGLMIAFLLLLVSMIAFAGYVEVKKGGKSIGGLTYSYRIQTDKEDGCFVHVEIQNGTGEFVRGRITGTGTEKICGTSFRVNPHGKTKEVFGCAETPKDVILEYVQVDD